MNILFDARVLGTPQLSGIGYYTRDLLKHLLSTTPDIHHTLFFNAHNPHSHQIFQKHTQSFPPHLQAHNYQPNKTITLKSILSSLSLPFSHQPDIVHLPHINTLTITGTKTICTIHDLSYEHFPHFLSNQDRLWHTLMAHKARQATHFIADSYSTQEDLTNLWHIPPQKITVIYPGPPLNQHKYRYNQDNSQTNRPTLLFIGTLEKRKNIPRLLQALYLLIKNKKCPNLLLILLGRPGNDYQTIQKTIQKLKLHQNVLIKNYCSQLEKQKWLHQSTLFIYPSLYEGFGLPLLEAMEAGLPIISSHLSSIPEVTGQAALLVNPYKPSEIATAIDDLLQSPRLQNQLIQSGYKQLQKFSWTQTSQQIQKLYQTL